MLLHVVKPPLPVYLDVDLSPRGQGCLCEMISLGPPARHSQHRDAIDCTMVIRLGKRNKNRQQWEAGLTLTPGHKDPGRKEVGAPWEGE